MERLSGATTDLQHIVHQGMSYYGATFWVGANAVIRKRALDDIVEIEHQGGFEIRRYVMDRTVIEDTESSIDLAIHGWRLLNYPERLSYSATPPDFGSLCIQRRRWANGGLIIMPKLCELRRARLKRAENNSTIETLLRVELSGLDLLEQHRPGVAAGLPVQQQAAQPAGAAGRGAVLHGDVVGPQALRLQADGHLPGLRVQPDPAAGQPGRRGEVDPAGHHRSADPVRPDTRRSRNRTATPLLFAISPFLIIGYSVFTVWRDVGNEFWGNAAFAAFNAITATYALFALMGAAERARRHLARLRGAAVRDRRGQKPQVAVRVRRRRRNRNRRRRPGRTCCTGAPRQRRPASTSSESTGMFRILAEVPEAPREAQPPRDRPGGRRHTAAGPAGSRRGSGPAPRRVGGRGGDGRRPGSDRLTGADDPIRAGDRVAGNGQHLE